MDVSPAGTVVAEQMSALERDFGDSDEHTIVGAISIILVEGPNGTTFRVRSNLGQPVVILGALRLAEDEFLRAMRGGGGIEQFGGEGQ